MKKPRKTTEFVVMDMVKHKKRVVIMHTGTANYWAQQVKALPIDSRERRTAFRHLAQQLCTEFDYPTLPVLTEADRAEICRTATRQTLAKLNHLLERCDLNAVCVATWFQTQLSRHEIPEAHQRWQQRQQRPSQSLQPEASLPPRFSPDRKRQIFEYIERDTSLDRRYYRGNLDVSFREVALMHIAGHSWQRLEQHFNISAFYQIGRASGRERV